MIIRKFINGRRITEPFSFMFKGTSKLKNPRWFQRSNDKLCLITNSQTDAGTQDCHSLS